MAGTTTGKWVARAGSTGGGRTYRGQRPVNWYASLVLICVLGVLSVVYSRYERQHPAVGVAPTTSSRWYVAVGFDECGTILPNLGANPNGTGKNAPGLSTTGNGIINVAPHTAAESGNNATLAKFVSEYPGLKLTSSTLKFPGTAQFTNGERCPAKTPQAGKVGNIVIHVWPNAQHGSGTTTKDPASVKFADGQLIEVAFLPSGVSVPKPVAALPTLLQDEATAAGSTTTTTAPTTSVNTSPPTTAASPSTTAAAPATTVPTPSTTTAPTTTTTKAK